MSQYLGDISAYALAVSQGYTGTEEEYAELMASYATVGQTAVTAAQTATTKASEAATSATTATTKASEATTAATTATNKAAEAQADADAAALDASQALSAASTATTKATEATTAAATATSAKTDAVAANTAAQSAKTAAQTAQAGAETAAASVQSSAAQIATNAEDISQLKSDIKYITGNKPYAFTEKKAVSNSETTTTLTYINDNDTNALIIPCVAGDVFTISGEGWSSLRLWAFAGAEEGGSYPILAKSNSAAVANKLILTAPTDSNYLIMNVKRTPTNYEGMVVSGTTIDKRVDDLSSIEDEHYDELNDKFDSIDIVEPVYGRNRCPDSFTDGYLNNQGEIVYHQNWKTTDFCYIYDFEKVWASATNNGSRITTPMYFCCTYDSNKNFIAYVGNIESMPATIADNVYYVRYTISKTYTDIMIENNVGHDANNFTPYEYSDVVKNQYIKKWHDKKWTVVGDSITAKTIRADENYHDYIHEKTGIKVHNMGVSGSGYAQGSGTNTAFYQRISSVPLDSDVITIFGSFNDNSAGLELGTVSDTGTTTIAGCINTTLDNLFTAFPLANVGIVTPCPWELYSPQSPSAYGRDYCELLVEICRRRSIPCLDLFYCSGLRPWDSSFKNLAYTKDEGNGTHPDEKGHFILSTKFEAFLNSLLLT